MYRFSLKKKRRRSRSIAPGGLVFLVVLLIYTFSGAGTDHAESPSPPEENTSSVSSEEGQDSTLPMVVSELADYSAPVADSLLAELSDEKVRVLLSDGSVAQVPLESYVAGVVASEMPSSFHIEALKAQAVAARTYALGRKAQYEQGVSKHPEAWVCSSTCCQVYRDEAGLRQVKSDEWYETDFNRVKNAVRETAGQLLYYQGALVEQPLFFSSAGGGRTENSEDVFAGTFAYLRSVSSDFDTPEKYTDKETVLPLDQVLNEVRTFAAENPSAVTILSDPPQSSADAGSSGSGSDSSVPQVQVLSRTEGDGAARISFGNIVLTGRQTRTLFNLPSADIEVSCSETSVTFSTRGSGHRVGMSQYGADGMGQHGYDYRQILQHYYSGTEVR